MDDAKKKMLTQVGVAVGAVLLVIVLFGKTLLGVFAPELLLSLTSHSSAPPAPPPPALAVGELPPTPATPQDDDSVEGAAGRALDDVRPELTPEKIAADPVKALRVVAGVVNEYPDTRAARAATAQAEAIRKAHAAKIDAANATAVLEIARLTAGSATRLEQLDHKALAADWRDLANRFAGLPAASGAIKERARVLAEWETFPREDRIAREKMSSLLGVSDTFDGRAQAALALRDFAVVYTATRCGPIATARADALVTALVTTIEEKVASDPQAGLTVVDAFPEKLRTGEAGQRIVRAREKAVAELTRRSQSSIVAIRAARNKGDFDQALGLLAGLMKADQDREKAAIEVHRTARDNKLSVDGGTFKSGPAGATKDSTVGPYFIDRLEVSNRAYRSYVKETGAPAPRDWNEGEPIEATYDLPVSGVSQPEAASYAKWLGARLPTALEWERAARGTDGRPYPWGMKWNKDALQWSSANLKAPGSFPAGESPVGALDMAGNVAEWTATVDGDKAAVKGGSRRETVEESFHVGITSWVPASKQDSTIGFRCAWDK